MASGAPHAMRAPFQVWREPPTVRLVLTRDSVAAGDDVDAPHRRTVEVPPFADPAALVRHVAAGYLPAVAGRGHAWRVSLNGRHIATVRGNVERVDAAVSEVRYIGEDRLHAAYVSASW